MNKHLYAWLQGVAERMEARSVPGVARAILTAVMRASTSEDAASGMIAMIGSLSEHEDDDDNDTAYINSMMADLSDSSRSNTSQRLNINRRN